jgi:acyl-CoA-binding protein
MQRKNSHTHSLSLSGKSKEKAQEEYIQLVEQLKEKFKK